MAVETRTYRMPVFTAAVCPDGSPGPFRARKYHHCGRSTCAWQMTSDEGVTMVGLYTCDTAHLDEIERHADVERLK